MTSRLSESMTTDCFNFSLANSLRNILRIFAWSSGWKRRSMIMSWLLSKEPGQKNCGAA